MVDEVTRVAVVQSGQKTANVAKLETSELASRWAGALTELEQVIAKARRRGGRHTAAAEAAEIIAESAREMIPRIERASRVVSDNQARVDRLEAEGRAASLKESGVTVVADISPATVDKEGGYRTMKTILLAQPNIDVVLGADTVVLGALAALREAGKAREDQFLGGIDGEQEAVAEIKKSASPYKASISLASSIFGYAMGQQAADWLEGKSIPQAMDILPRALTGSNIADYERDTANPGAVYADPARRASYLKMYGNICYETRDRFVNFAWSSVRRTLA